jgi:serine/threonine-protein kinase ATR
MISRISHPNPAVYEVLSQFIQKIVASYPSQALWSLLAVEKSTISERASRGAGILSKLKV